jgi:multidrug resistance efflux pump
MPVADPGVNGVVRQASDTTTYDNDSDEDVLSTEKTSYSGNPYRHPFIEASAKLCRAQVRLNDEMFANFLATLSVNDLSEVLNNELSAVDQDVRRVQAAYMNTILFSPISGTITGVYKRVGEAVAAGEPILRVENNDTINVAGAVVYGDMISLGDDVTINTTLFGANAAELSGTVSAARCVGGNGGDNRWHVVFACDNLDDDGSHIVPDNYNFSDVDTTANFA